MIGHLFPGDELEAVLPDGSVDPTFSVPVFCSGSFGLVFFYPLNFSRVCSTEVVAYREAFDEYSRRGVKVIGVSLDSRFSHSFWRQTPQEFGGLGGALPFPLVSDLERRLAGQLGILNEKGLPFRATYLLDPDGIVRYLSINEILIGRSALEPMRNLDALMHHSKSGEPCMANWIRG